jgi:hypothetical protein
MLARGALFLLAALLGAGIGLFDHAQSEVQPAVILLLGCAFAFAFVRPRDAWASGLILGAGVPIVDLVSRALGQPAAWPSAPGSSVLAFVPALLGTGLGWVSSRFTRGLGQSSDSRR